VAHHAVAKCFIPSVEAPHQAQAGMFLFYL